MTFNRTMTFDEFLAEWRGDSPSITAHTSGSTGTPKTITLDKGFVRESALRTNSFFRIDNRSRLHSCVAADFIGGKMMGVRAEISGSRLTWEPPSNRPLQGVGKDEDIDLLAVVPSQMLYIVDHLEEMPRIGNVIVGGSAIHPELVRKIKESGLNAYESYGMTETASHISLRRIGDNDGWFETLPGITVSTDERGCLEIHFLSGEIVVTNDLARLAGDSRFRIDGRYDRIIISGGRKINPEEVERKISPLFKGKIMVRGEKDEKWGERVVLRIEETPEERERKEKERKMKEILESWEYPKKIEWGAVIEVTENGKLRLK